MSGELLDKETSVIPTPILFNLMTITHYSVDWYQDMRLDSRPSFSTLHCLVSQRTGRAAGGGKLSASLSALHFFDIVLLQLWEKKTQHTLWDPIPPDTPVTMEDHNELHSKSVNHRWSRAGYSYVAVHMRQTFDVSYCALQVITCIWLTRFPI